MNEYYNEQFKKEPSLKEKVDKTYDFINSLSEKEKKKLDKEMRKTLKIPRKAKTSKMRRKKAWCGVIFLNENRNTKGEKVQLEGGTYKTKDGNYHVTNGSELIFWEGKYPLLWQRYDKLNPINLVAKEGDKNEIYGQDLIKLRMKRDAIKEKKKGGGMSIMIMIAILVGGYFLIKAFFPGLFGG